MPTKINVMFDNFNIQTWKEFLVTLKKNTWFTEKTCKTNTQKTNKKQQNRKKKIQKKPKIFMKVE